MMCGNWNVWQRFYYITVWRSYWKFWQIFCSYTAAKVSNTAYDVSEMFGKHSADTLLFRSALQHVIPGDWNVWQRIYYTLTLLWRSALQHMWWPKCFAGILLLQVLLKVITTACDAWWQVLRQNFASPHVCKDSKLLVTVVT